MNIILVLIPVTLLIIATAIAIFFWAVNHHQFDDLESPGALPLMEEDQGEKAQQDVHPIDPGTRP